MSLNDDLVLQPLSAPTTVSTLTVLRDWFLAGAPTAAVLEVTLANLDPTNGAVLQVDVGETGSLPNVLARQTVDVAAQSEGRVQLGPLPPTYVRISASGASPGFLAVSVQWKVRGVSWSRWAGG